MHAFEVITVDPTGSEYDALLECSTTVFRGLPSRLGLYSRQSLTISSTVTPECQYSPGL